MRVLIAALAASLCLASANKLGEEDYQSLFSTFITQHGKTYATSEFFSRFNTFKTNLDKIREHNADGSNSIKLGVNAFTDMTPAEFKSTMLGYNHREQSYFRSKNVVDSASLNDAPDAIDWRDHNAVTPVKNQGQCGSCWAFSTTGSVEGALAIAGKGLNSLSEQQLMDCSNSYGNEGCNGGIMDDAFQFIMKKGITTEKAYPYTAKDGVCKAKTGEFKISSFTDVKEGDETDLLAKVVIGPVSVAIEADQLSFQSYTSGILEEGCGNYLDHGVLVVGYGTENGKDYWIVKNSWGASWGEKGYIRIIRNKGMCGIADAASIPIA